jgi:hypothetical protein
MRCLGAAVKLRARLRVSFLAAPDGPGEDGRVSKPLIVVVLLIAALASAALVFFAMSAFSEEEAPPVVASEPTSSAPAPEPEPAPTDAELVVRTDITDANLFVDAFDRGPIEPESWRTLPLGPHRIEARRGATVIAALTVELGPNGADVELHADGTTAQVARTEPPARVASARTREGDRAVGQPTPSAPGEPTPSNDPTPSAAPSAPEPSAPNHAPNEPAPSAPTVATAPRVEPPPGVEPAPAAPIFGARPSAGIQVVDQNQAHTVTPPPVTPTVAPRVAAPVAPAAPPNEAQMRRALDSVIPAVRTCAGDFHGELDVTVSFAPDGTTRARIGRLPTREARYCVQGAIHERVRVPAFTGRATQIRHVYRL